MLFGVYLLIRKRAVLRYIYRLLAVYVSLLANIGVLYHKTCLKSSENRKNVHDSKFVLSIPIKDIGTGLVKREAYQVFKDVACLRENLQVKCFGGFVSYFVNREAYLVRGKTA